MGAGNVSGAGVALSAFGFGGSGSSAFGMGASGTPDGGGASAISKGCSDLDWREIKHNLCAKGCLG